MGPKKCLNAKNAATIGKNRENRSSPNFGGTPILTKDKMKYL